MRWGCSVWIILFLLFILLLGSGHKYEPIEDPIHIPRPCSLELIQLAEQVLQDEEMRKINIRRIEELDPSEEMLIAIELQDNDKLREIVEEIKTSCHLERLP
jgi:hypothetical protein